MALSQQSFELLKEYIHTECALEIPNEKKYLIESRLSPLMHKTGAHDFNEFYHIAKKDRTYELRNKIVDAITTHETLWFRDLKAWDTLETCILPKLAESISTGKQSKARIWSAACSSGQEPYSIAMLIEKMLSSGKLPNNAKNSFEIIASDVSRNSIASAKAGKYNQLEMNRGLSSEYMKFFNREGNYHIISDEIKSKVDFITFNLQDSFHSLGSMDLVLCRNVLIYFSEEFKKDLLKRIVAKINPGGFFLLSSTESTMGDRKNYDMLTDNNSIYYRVKNHI